LSRVRLRASHAPRLGADQVFRPWHGKVLGTTAVFDTFWRFAFERQEVFFKRLAGLPPPWTNDPVLCGYRFTNVYRASDRVSQYLIRRVIYDGEQSDEEVFFRILLFKLFNRVQTWEVLQTAVGPISWRAFHLEQYNAALEETLRRGERIYSAAYIMPCPPFGARRKHTNHLILLARMMEDRVPLRLASARSLRDVYTLLRSYPSIGDFLAFQFAIDLNYSGLIDFPEMEFVVPGPGARSGVRKAFSDTAGLSEEEVIRAVAEAASREFERRGLAFRSLWGRPIQLIDCQNLFCEVDKYARVVHPEIAGNGRTRIKRRFTASAIASPQWYPPKWRLSSSNTPTGES